MLKKAVLLALIILATKGYSLHFVSYGDTRTYSATHNSVLSAIAARNPELIINSGDLWDGYYSTEDSSKTRFRQLLQSKPVISALLDANKYLVARGNHETETSFLSFTPTLTRNNSLKYSFYMDSCFFISTGYSPSNDTAWLRQQLSSSQAQNAAWRIVFAHAPVYSSLGSHGANGMPGVEKLFDTYKVNLFFAGHDHHYERTYMRYTQQNVTTSNDITGYNGTVYFVTGGGGAPLRSVTTNSWTAFSQAVTHYCDVVTTPTSLIVKVYKTDGTMIDNVTIRKGTPPPDTSAPVISSTAPTGVLNSKQVTLSCKTNEKANVRWSTTNTTYDLMTNQFSTGEGTLDHSTNVTVAHNLSYTYYVRAKDSSGNASKSSSVITFRVDTTILSWYDRLYNDDSWATGGAELGYGDSDEVTKVSYGPSSTSKYVTTYFRKDFNVINPASITSLIFYLKYDDGAVAYINGHEIKRINMPAGPIAYATFAATNKEGQVTDTITGISQYLVSGQNVLAVEIHQENQNSSDISFNASLKSGTTVLISTGAVWSYYDKGSMPAVQGQVPVSVINAAVNGKEHLSLSSVNRNRIQIEIGPAGFTGKIQLLNSQGKSVFSGNYSQQQNRIIISGSTLRSGAYVLQINSADGQSLNRTVIIN